MNVKTEGGEVSPWLDADEIKAQISIESVLARYGILETLKRKGSRLVGKSPFREEQTPSFSVNTERNIWNDFGGKGDVPGNVIGLVQAIENVSFREALVILQRDFVQRTLNAPSRKTEEPAKKSTEAERKKEPVENIPFGRELKGLRYDVPILKEKGIRTETCKAFSVGYCSSGLMKGRIVFPVRGTTGEIMAYAGRAVKKADEEENGKYKFPNGFNKSLELYNIDRVANDPETKKAVKDFGIVLVEGFTDVLKLCQEGFLNAVALMGSDFHEAQKRMLLNPTLNPTRRITVFLDNDEAGQNGKRETARQLIYDGFVRYVDWSDVPPEKTEPEHFVKEELAAILGFRK